MKQFFIAVACISLCSGCVSYRTCRVAFAPDHAEVLVSKELSSLIPMPGICGFTSHVSQTGLFMLAGLKPEYQDAEIQEIPPMLGMPTNAYRGSISISREKKRVEVRLRLRGGDGKDYPSELNGTYHYQSCVTQ
jgi:hypothetical protein